MNFIDPDINTFAGNLVELHTVVSGASRFHKLELSDPNVQRLADTVSNYQKSLEALKGPLTETPVKDSPKTGLRRKITVIHEDVARCSCCLDILVSHLEKMPEQRELIANIDRMRRTMQEVDTLLNEESKPLPPIPERSEPIPSVGLPQAQATKATRLLAARDALFGSVVAFAKELISIPLKGLFLGFSCLLDAYLRLGLWNGSKASLEILVLLTRKTLSALVKTALKLPCNVILASTGIIKPSLWVSITEVKEKETKPYFPLRSLTTALYGVLCPVDGHVFAYQKYDGGARRLMEYTTGLEGDAEAASDHWFDFNERANRLIASFESQ